MPVRLRCTQCEKLVDEDDLVEHKNAERLKKTKPGDGSYGFVQSLLRQRFHRRMFSQSAGRGRIGSRVWTDHCGPVEEEQVDEYVLQLEHWLGIKV